VAQARAARLVALGHQGVQGHAVLDRNQLVIGRDPRSDLVLDHPAVSWRHAEVCRSGDRWTVRDLGSTNGTALHGRPVHGPVEIRDGDVLLLGQVSVRLDDPGSARPGGPPTMVAPAVPPAPPGSGGSGSHPGFSVGDQWARGTINNVEGTQNNYQQILNQRESFLREVAATRTKARWFVWLGLILFVGGIGLDLYMAQQAYGSISDWIGKLPSMNSSSAAAPTLPGAFGADFGTLYVVAAAAVYGGPILIIVGIVLHIVATARRRRIDERLPAPWPPTY
jgi:hypothetical protein